MPPSASSPEIPPPEGEVAAAAGHKSAVVNGQVVALTADGEIDDDLGGVPVEVEHVSATKKKRKKARPKSQRGLVCPTITTGYELRLTIPTNKPTGFEEYHADGPLRPEEAAEDQELYSSNYPFINRILTAVKRFERTRKLSSERRDVFYKYLAYGGIDVGPQMFQSVQAFDKDARKAMSKTELAEAMSQLSIGDDKYDTSSPDALYTVDFEGCVRAFLSRRAPDIWCFETHDSVSLVTTTLERFLDYLLQHNVCPEYEDDVLATRNLCRQANSELRALAEASLWLPGSFNIACSTLFDGQYARNYDGQSDWTPGGSEPTFLGMTRDTAEAVLKFGIAGAAPEHVYVAFQAHNQANNFEDRVQVVETRSGGGFEITKLVPPTRQCIQLYKQQSKGFISVGRLYARSWKNPDLPPDDLTNEEKQALAHPSAAQSKDEYLFLLESVILNQLRPGCKIEATVSKLNCGIWFFDEIINTYPSFDAWLPNNIMHDWKEPRWVEGSVEFEKLQESERQRRSEEVDKLEERDMDVSLTEHVEPNEADQYEAHGARNNEDGLIDPQMSKLERDETTRE
ncbi:hypothetical protein DV737_g585, partial [Chaetothyriales sp. CBS 132003]